MNFGCRRTIILNTTIEKTVEKCAELYKGIYFVHNQCMVLVGALDQDFPVREEHLKNLQGWFLKGEERISKLEVISEEDIRI